MRQNDDTFGRTSPKHSCSLTPLISPKSVSETADLAGASHKTVRGSNSLRLSLRGNGRNYEHYPTMKKPLDRLATVRGATLEGDVKEFE